MKKLLESKKGINDVSLMWGIILIFVLIGALIPYVNNSFNTSENEFNVNQFDDQIDDETDFTALSATKILLSIASMFFWTFGTLPFWLDAIFLVMRVMLGLLIYRQVRSGGG